MTRPCVQCPPAKRGRGQTVPVITERHAPDLPGRAVIAQRWNRAIFVHWRIDPAEVFDSPEFKEDLDRARRLINR